MDACVVYSRSANNRNSWRPANCMSPFFYCNLPKLGEVLFAGQLAVTNSCSFKTTVIYDKCLRIGILIREWALCKKYLDSYSGNTWQSSCYHPMRKMIKLLSAFTEPIKLVRVLVAIAHNEWARYNTYLVRDLSWSRFKVFECHLHVFSYVRRWEDYLFHHAVWAFSLNCTLFENESE